MVLQSKLQRTGADLAEFHLVALPPHLPVWKFCATIRRPIGPRDLPFRPLSQRAVDVQGRVLECGRDRLERRHRGMDASSQTDVTESPPAVEQFMRWLFLEEHRLEWGRVVAEWRRRGLPFLAQSAGEYAESKLR